MSPPTALLLLLAAACSHRPPEAPAPEPSRLEAQRALADEPGKDQTLEVVRLASLALAEGDLATAEAALRRAVPPMQDFRADGELKALLGAERSKEWKGDPYEKMMAFLYLAVLLLEEGDEGNALAMTKSAILADTGTSRFPYRADFVTAFVVQSLVYERMGEPHNARRSAMQAADVVAARRWTEELVRLLDTVEPVVDDERADAAARALLLSALPNVLMATPRDPERAIDLALSQATDLRMAVMDGKKDDRPDDLVLLRRRDAKRSLEALEPLARAWREALRGSGTDLADAVEAETQRLTALAEDPPSLVLLVEAGEGPMKVGDGEYGHILRFVSRSDGEPAPIRVDGRPLSPAFLDSLTFQASTRGSRWVDGFLKGKAVFKDASPALGWALLVSGDVARALQDSEDSGAVGTVLYLAGVTTWVAGALANPRADTRAWLELPEGLWLVAEDLPPGEHEVRVGPRAYTVNIPADGTVVHLIPALPPGGAKAFGGPP